MNRIAKFEKVSIGQFTAAWKDTFQEQSEEKICEIYGAPRPDWASSTGNTPSSIKGNRRKCRI